MTSHIVVTALVCAATCQPAELRVWDGDTFRVGLTSSGEAVRILSIDAPEIEGACPFERNLAQAAKRGLAAILDGARVELRRAGEDRYGRTLADVMADGRNAGDELVHLGLARTWTGRRESWCE